MNRVYHLPVRCQVSETLGNDASLIVVHTYSVSALLEWVGCSWLWVAGDCVEGRGFTVPELTPVAVQSGEMLARRLFQATEDKVITNCYPHTLVGHDGRSEYHQVSHSRLLPMA